MSAFYTHKQEWVVEEKDNGTIPSLDYGALAEMQKNGVGITPVRRHQQRRDPGVLDRAHIRE